MLAWKPTESALTRISTTSAAFFPARRVAEHLLRELLTTEDLRVHSITHRVKTKKSLERKISEKASEYQSLDDVHDLLGCRVITYFPDEVDAVAAVVEREFAVDWPNSVDKRALLDPDRFGYLSLHYVVTFNDSRVALAEYARFGGCRFEIQIRSILQHAWAEIEHDLGYHTTGAVPRTIRRRFSRLAGMLEMADDEFNNVSERRPPHIRTHSALRLCPRLTPFPWTGTRSPPSFRPQSSSVIPTPKSSPLIKAR